MKKILVLALALILAVLLCISGALAETLLPTNIPITIDGVRVAFFDAAGTYLQPMERDGLVWVPLTSLCENLCRESEVQGQAVVVDGQRVGMFDTAGNFLMPIDVNGVAYVPLIPFCESVGIDVTVEGEAIALLREDTTPVSTPAPTSVPTEAPTAAPVYGYVPLTAANFLDFFTVSTSSSVSGSGNKVITYTAVCEATTSYGLENVKFVMNGFGTITVPAYGYATASYKETVYAQGSDTRSETVAALDATIRASAASFTVTEASGKLRMSYQEAEAIKAGYYEQAQAHYQTGLYEQAIGWYEILAMDNYRDSALMLKEAQAAQKRKEAEETAAKEKTEEAKKLQKYEEATALLNEGKYAEAEEAFGSLGNYKDSAEKYAEAQAKRLEAEYQAAVKAQEEGRWQEAIDQFTALGDYEDAAQRITDCQTAMEQAKIETDYQTALKWEAIGNHDSAIKAFTRLGEYKDSAQRVVKNTLQKARQLMDEGKFSECQELVEPYAQTDPEAEKLLFEALFHVNGIKASLICEGLVLVEYKVTHTEQGSDTVYIDKHQMALMDVQGNILRVMDWEALGEWSEGFWVVKPSSTFGNYFYMNAQGENEFGQEFKTAEPFRQGKALVTTLDDRAVVIDTTGQEVAELPVKKGRVYMSYLGEDLVSFKDYDKKGNWGLINLTGKVILNAKYEGYDDGILPFSYGLAPVSGYSGIINTKGTEVVKLSQNTIIEILSENMIARNKDKKGYTITDLKNKKLYNDVYESIRREGDLIIAQKDGKYGALDLDLNEVIPFEYEDIIVGYQSQWLALYKNGSFGIYNINDLSKAYQQNTEQQMRVRYNEFVYKWPVEMSPDAPYIVWKTEDKGWVILDGEGNIIF